MSNKYVGVLARANSGYDAFVFKRDYSQKEAGVYGCLKVADNQLIANIALKDDQSTGMSFLYTSVFRDRIEETGYYRQLFVDQYIIKTMTLKATKLANSYKNVI